MYVSGVPGQTTLYVRPSFSGFMFEGDNKDNVTIEHLRLVTDMVSRSASAIYHTGGHDNVYRDLYIENLGYGLKLGGGYLGQRFLVEDITMRSMSQQAMYLHDIEDSTFRRLSLQNGSSLATALDHPLYMSAGIYRCSFDDVELSKPGGFALHMYIGYAGRTSSNVTFNNLRVDATEGLHASIICDGWSNVTITNSVWINGDDDRGLLYFSGTGTMIVDGFTASGAEKLVSIDADRPYEMIYIKNGTYNGPFLIDRDDEPYITFENVVLQ